MSTPKALLRALDARDGRACAWHGFGCGVETLVPQHRANRGHGGRKSLNRLSNLVWLCSFINTDIETTAVTAALARRTGIKISSHSEPSLEPIHHAIHGFVLLGDDGSVTQVEKEVA